MLGLSPCFANFRLTLYKFWVTGFQKKKFNVHPEWIVKYFLVDLLRNKKADTPIKKFRDC